MGGIYARKTVREQIRLDKRRFPRSIFLTRGQRYSPLAAFRVQTQNKSYFNTGLNYSVTCHINIHGCCLSRLILWQGSLHRFSSRSAELMSYWEAVHDIPSTQDVSRGGRLGGLFGGHPRAWSSAACLSRRSARRRSPPPTSRWRVDPLRFCSRQTFLCSSVARAVLRLIMPPSRWARVRRGQRKTCRPWLLPRRAARSSLMRSLSPRIRRLRGLNLRSFAQARLIDYRHTE